jgi:hypothetical protein
MLRGMFDYSVRVERGAATGATGWIGRCQQRRPRPHELVGFEPTLELSLGRMTLRASEPAERWRDDPLCQKYSWPCAAVACDIGPLLESLLAAGDELVVSRGGMAEKTLLIVREGMLVVAIGALCGWELPGDPAALVRDDPWTDLYTDSYYARLLRESRAHLLWVDPKIEDAETTLRRIDALDPGRPVVIGYCGNRLPGLLEQERARLGTRFGIVLFERRPRFPTLEDWRDHLSRVVQPQTARPKPPSFDLKLSFNVGDAELRLASEEQAAAGPFALRAGVVSYVPHWRPSTAAIVREPPTTDRTALKRSLEAVTSTDLEMIRYEEDSR